jgi:formylglycine-generating enzyme required for sulfatase activity
MKKRRAAKIKQAIGIAVGMALVLMGVLASCSIAPAATSTPSVETLVRQQFQETEQAQTLEAAFEQAQQATAAIVVATQQARATIFEATHQAWTAQTATQAAIVQATQQAQAAQTATQAVNIQATQQAIAAQTATQAAIVQATQQAQAAQTATQAVNMQATQVAQIASQTAIAFATRKAEVLASAPVITNADWTPVVQDVGGVPMVLVPAGCFMMGSTTGDRDEQPVHEQCFEQAFWIGQMEVTNAQYKAFIDAGGYTNAAYWMDAGWSWRQIEGITQPDCWTDSTFNQSNYPVVCVSWYEAIAYSLWLSATSGEAFRLPTEAEWEYAARGPDGLVYPWGNEWNANKAITSETSNGESANSVGSRPAGASWVGALDMSGNVWEWMSLLYQSYPYDATDGREDVQADGQQVLRGGSWSFNLDLARAASRLNYSPNFRNFSLGFRVTALIPIS